MNPVWTRCLLPLAALTAFTSALISDFQLASANPSRQTGRDQGAIAQASSSTRQRRKRIAFIPRQVGTVPSRRVPGGVRGSACKAGAQKLTALTPEWDPQVVSSSTPTFLFYVPLASAQALEFVLQDEAGNLVYQQTYAPAPRSGVIRINPAADPASPVMQVGKPYYWAFSMVCDRTDRSRDVMVDGEIQRVEPDAALAAKLAITDGYDRAALYAASGFWHDALTTLVDLRQANPNDGSLQEDWQDLLRSVGLSSIAQEPLLPCCTLQSVARPAL